MNKCEYTTDIEAFLSGCDIELEDERDDLLAAIKHRTFRGSYRAWSAKGQLFVQGTDETVLRVPSERATAELLRRIHALALDVDDVEVDFQRAMANPHA